MSFRRRALPYLYALLAVGSAGAAVFYVNTLARIDPFAGLRGAPGAANPIAMELKNVDMRHWSGGKLVASGHIGSLAIQRDRTMFEFNDVTNGVYYSGSARFAYSAQQALWFAPQQRLEGSGGIRASGKGFELQARTFHYDAKVGRLTIPGSVSGTLSGGNVVAQDVSYDVNTKEYSTRHIDWIGKFAVDLQNPDQSHPAPDDVKSRTWHFTGDKTWSTYEGKGKTQVEIQHFTNGHGTDGDSIVTAPEVERNTKTDVVTCEGPVKYWSAKANLVCDHMVIYRKEKRAVLTGNVVMYVKPEDKQELDEKMEVPPFEPVVPEKISETRPPAPMVSDPRGSADDDEVRSNDTIKKYPATVRADRVEYWYAKGNRHAIITGSPQAQQELLGGRWRMAWAFKALYDGEKERLTLLSAEGKRDVRMKNSLGDDMTATDGWVSTKDGDDSYYATHPDMTYVDTNQEDNETAAKAAADKKNAKKKPPPPKTQPGLNGPIGKSG